MGEVYFSFLETRSCYVVQTGLQLQVSSNPPASVFQVAETTCMCHHAWLTVKHTDASLLALAAMNQKQTKASTFL
jgi:hypothetical protein